MEILDICDELGNPTGKTVEREIAHQQGILHRTAHVWILRKKENKIQILLTGTETAQLQWQPHTHQIPIQR